MTAVIERASAQDPAPDPGHPEPPLSSSPARSGGEGPPKAVLRLRIAAVSLGLTLLAFVQEPERLSPDTKLDLLVDPWGLMARALHMWEPLGFLGQVQNQGYGYLFPMGPFFGLFDLVGVQDWITQRLWWALLLNLSFLGVLLVARRLGIGTVLPQVLAGLAYALAPRMMSTLGPISVEALPMALAPWVLLPLIRGSQVGSPRRAAALSGVAVLCVGGVNAAATAMVLVLPALYLLTREPGPRRRPLMGWWALSVGLATLWWAVPLVLLGRYSPPFLDYIEGAAVTTLPTNLIETLRGTDHWIGFVIGESGPVWPTGWILVTTGVVIAYTGLVAALGLSGLALRSIPERRFLVAGAAAGLLLVTFGHVGEATGLLAQAQQSWLDGVLSPLRNVHKFDPVLRLVLALGLAHLLTVVVRKAHRTPGWEPVAPAAVALVLLGVVGSSYPALTSQVVPPGSFYSVPDYWDEASAYVADRDPTGRSLIVPGAPFGRFLWGNPRDEPFQAFGRGPWAVRDAVPLTPPATIRMLDAVQRRLAAGQPTPGLADELASAGVRFLVIRNDLDTAGGQAALPSVVHEALRGVVGLRFLADFGPLVGGQVSDDTVVDRGLSVPYRAVEVYEVTGYTDPVGVVPLSEVPTVVGGPEDVLTARDQGVLGPGPAVLAGDEVAGAAGPVIQADGIARRELNPGRVDDNVSERLTPDDPLTLDRRVRDYLAFPDDRADAPARSDGPVSVTASSSGSAADTPGGPVPARQPLSAMDGDVDTAWWSSVQEGAVDQWWEVDFGAEVSVSDSALLLDTSTPGPDVTRVRVTTDAGDVDIEVGEDGVVPMDAVSGRTRTLRVTALDVSEDGDGLVFGIRELTVPGIVAARTAVTPRAEAEPDVVVLAATVDARPDCVHPPSQTVCTNLIARPGEEQASVDRVVDLGAAGPRELTVSVVPRSGAWLDRVIAEATAEQGRPLTATASSSAVAAPEANARAAVDGDLSTTWVADSEDEDPVLVLDLGETRTVTGLRLRQRLGVNASRPITAQIESREGEIRSGRFRRDGVLQFRDPVRTDRLVVKFPLVQTIYSLDPVVAGGGVLPLGVSDLVVRGAEDLHPDPAVGGLVEIPCGEGPVVRVGDNIVSTRAVATLPDLIQRLPVRAEVCEPVTAVGGPERVVASGAGRWVVRSVTVAPPGTVAAGTSAPVAAARTGAEGVRVEEWGPTARSVAVGDRSEDSLLVVRENVNAGWAASLDGVALEPVRVDGWAQGWILPAGAAGTVSLTYGPDLLYRLGLLAGLLAALLLLVLALRPGRDPGSGPTGPRRIGPAVTLPVAAVVMLLLGGPWALLLGAVVAGLSLLVPDRVRVWLWPAASGLLVLVATALLVARPWSASGGYAGEWWVTQMLCLGALSLALVPWLPRHWWNLRPGPGASATVGGSTGGGGAG